MRSTLLLILITGISTSIAAGDWAVGASSGPFIFGNLSETRSTISVGGPGQTVTHSLSASTRAGAVLGVDRFFNARFSVRAEISYTTAPLAIKSDSGGDDGVALDVGDLTIASLALPAVFRFNRGGRLRPYLLAGPAYVVYDIDLERRASTAPLFEGSRGEWGVVGGGGAEWWWGDRWGARAEVTDLVTESPLTKSDFAGTPPRRLTIPRPHSIHTSFGLKYRF